MVLSDSEPRAKNGAEPDYLIPVNTSLKLLCELLDNLNDGDVAVIGGRKMLAEAIEFAGKVSVTENNADLVQDADVYFHAWGLQYLGKHGKLTSKTVPYGRILEWDL